MRKQQRLKRRRDFAAVYRRGRYHGDELVALRVLASGRKQTRFGFVVGKRVGKAVVRNRVRRRLREAMLTFPVSQGWDIVVGARPPAADVDYHRLGEALARLCSRAGVLDGERDERGAEEG